MPKKFSSYLFTLILCLLSLQINSQTTLEKTDTGWSLEVDGKPFVIKGATFGYDEEVANYDNYFQDLSYLGVNTIRTWATGENTPALLDAAQKQGIKVMLGIWMRHGRPGMEDDDSFNYLEDKIGMEAMYQNALETVENYKDHPALLTWGVGNEVYLNTETDAEKEAYSKFLERVCSTIKKIDQAHPIVSVEAWTFGLEWWQKYVPSIDIYGLNSYGPGAGILSEELAKRKIDQPYIITEFGVTGEWDIQQEKHGVKQEPTDQQKYEAIVQGYNNWIKPKPSCLGVYVFHYANGNDFTASWLLTHFNGWKRPQYWAIREAYTGLKPVNLVPEISNFSLPKTQTNSGSWVLLDLSVSDFENEALELSFYYNQRTGSRKRRSQLLPLNFRGNLSTRLEIQVPAVDGAIKVYAMAKDSYGNLGIASTAMLAADEEARKRKYLVPKVKLPFYVYKDNENNPYTPSGYMGNYQAIGVDTDYTEDFYAGTSSIKISYNAIDNWYGVGFVDPANDWGDILGGYDLSGAKTFSFWAKANDDNVKATIGFGLIKKDKPFPDTAIESIDVVLNKKWKKYTIKTKKLDLTCIRSGLVLFSSSDGFRHEIYLDEVVFE